jgi:Fe-S cluster assembly ATPase SufC
MAEPYSDEQLEMWNASTPVQMGGVRNEKWLATANRLQRERDEARRVAKALSEAVAENLTPMERAAVEVAEGYPEAKL